MAKLSARGRTELLRMSKPLEDSDFFIERHKLIAYMSDGTILEKHTARHKPTNWYPGGKPANWGWKVGQKLKQDAFTVDQVKAHFEKHGYTEVRK